MVSVVGIADQTVSDASSTTSTSSDVAGMCRNKHISRVWGDVRSRQVPPLLPSELGDGLHLTVQVAVAPLQRIAEPE